MPSGVVTKTLNGYYYVQDGNEIVRCKIRGRIKKERFLLCVGDKVEYTINDNSDGIVEKILPRRSLLKRPLAANIDQVIITFAAKDPDPSCLLIDRFLVMAEYSEINIIICFNKCDLADSQELALLVNTYTKAGYKVITVSAKKKINLDELRSCLKDRLSVFAGPSGAGKSSLLNAIEPGLSLKTGEVTEKLGRGTHTTRAAELLAFSEGGYIVDTPGFSFTEFPYIEKTELSSCFPDFSLTESCKFSSCLHDRESHCAVKKALDEGHISKERYASYLHILAEIQQAKKGYR